LDLVAISFRHLKGGGHGAGPQRRGDSYVSWFDDRQIPVGHPPTSKKPLTLSSSLNCICCEKGRSTGCLETVGLFYDRVSLLEADFAQNPVRTIGLLDPFGQPSGALIPFENAYIADGSGPLQY
jgi:hypothetical protein